MMTGCVLWIWYVVHNENIFNMFAQTYTAAYLDHFEIVCCFSDQSALIKKIYISLNSFRITLWMSLCGYFFILEKMYKFPRGKCEEVLYITTNCAFISLSLGVLTQTSCCTWGFYLLSVHLACVYHISSNNTSRFLKAQNLKCDILTTLIPFTLHHFLFAL